MEIATSNCATGVLVDITEVANSDNAIETLQDNYNVEDDVFFYPEKEFLNKPNKDLKFSGTSPACGKLVDIDSFEKSSEICDPVINNKTIFIKNLDVTDQNVPDLIPCEVKSSSQVEEMELLELEQFDFDFPVSPSVKDKSAKTIFENDISYTEDKRLQEKIIECKIGKPASPVNDEHMAEIFKEATALSLHLMQKENDNNNIISGQEKVGLNMETQGKDLQDDSNISEKTAPFTRTNYEINEGDPNNNFEVHAEMTPKSPLKDIKRIKSEFSAKISETKCKHPSKKNKENVPLVGKNKLQNDCEPRLLKRSGTFRVNKTSIQRQNFLKNSKESNRPMSTLSSSLKTNILRPKAKSVKSDSSFSKVSNVIPVTTTEKNSSLKRLNSTTKIRTSKVDDSMSKNACSAATPISSKSNETITKNANKLALKSDSGNGVISGKFKTPTKPAVRRSLLNSSANDSSSSSIKSSDMKLSSSKLSIPKSSTNLVNRSSISLQRSNSSFSSSLSSSCSNDVFVNQSSKELIKAKCLARPASVASHPQSLLKKPVNSKISGLKFRSVSLKSDVAATNRRGPLRAVTPLTKMIKPSSGTQKVLSPVSRKAISRSQDDLVSTPGSSSFTMTDPLAVSTPNYDDKHHMFKFGEKGCLPTPVIASTPNKEPSKITRSILHSPGISRLRKPSPIKK